MLSHSNRTLGRRRFLSTAIMTLAATQLSMTACEEANSSVPKPAGVPTMRPGTNTSLSTPLPAQLGPPFTHQIAQVNGIRIHYVIGGQGFPVVLLHGWPFYSLSQVAENVSGGIIPHCGHYIAEEQPEELLRQFNAFFSGQEE